jgi:GNAT superfamily N-acetyltransferase
MIRVRLATPDDAEHMQRIHTSAVRGLCAQHYTTEQIAVWLSGRTAARYLAGILRGEMLMAEWGREPVGFAHAVPGAVLALFVAAEYSGRGIGSALLEAAVEVAGHAHAGPIKLDATLNAVSFYQQFGFVAVRAGVATKRGVHMPSLVMEKPASRSAPSTDTGGYRSRRSPA